MHPRTAAGLHDDRLATEQGRIRGVDIRGRSSAAGMIGVVAPRFPDARIMGFGFEQVGFLHQSINKGEMSLFESLLHKCCHEHIASHVDVFAEPEAVFRRAQTNFYGLLGLMGECTSQRPFSLDVKAHGRIAMRLKAVDEVVEAGLISHLSRDEAAREIADFVCEGVPDAVEFFGSCFRGGFYRMALFDQRVEVYHFHMAMECFDDCFTRDPGRERCYRGEDCSF